MEATHSESSRNYAPSNDSADSPGSDDDDDLGDVLSVSDEGGSEGAHLPEYKQSISHQVNSVLQLPMQRARQLWSSVTSKFQRNTLPRDPDSQSLFSLSEDWDSGESMGRRGVSGIFQDVLFSSWMNVLLLFVPIGISSHLFQMKPMIIFASNAMAIIPLSAVLTDATERIAAQAGDTVGALLNISLGNLVELILFIVALANNQIRIVQASILGSILVNLLLILGTALLAGSAINFEPTYNTAEAQLLACLLFVSVFTFMVPAAFDYTYDNKAGTADAILKMSRISSLLTLLIYVVYFVHELRSRSPTRDDMAVDDTLDLERNQPPLMGLATPELQRPQALPPRTIRFADEDTQLASHSNHTHPISDQPVPRIELDVLSNAGSDADDDEPDEHRGRQPGQSVGSKPWTSSYQPQRMRAVRHTRSISLNSNRSFLSRDSSVNGEPRTFPRSGLTTLQLLRDSRLEQDQFFPDRPATNHGRREMIACAAILMATSMVMSVCAEFLVGAIDDVTHESHLSESIIGLIILPIVGNIAEYVTVVTVAVRDKLDLAIAVSVGSAIQIALCVTPLTVIAGWIMGRQLALTFNFFEMATLFGSVLLVNLLILNETSHSLRTSGLKGALMCTCYVIIALGAYFATDS